jgi:hypothetical protein
VCPEMEILSKYGDEAVTGPTGSFACMGPVVVLLFGLLCLAVEAPPSSVPLRGAGSFID